MVLPAKIIRRAQGFFFCFLFLLFLLFLFLVFGLVCTQQNMNSKTRARLVCGVGLIAIVCWFLSSGIVYDLIHRPPSVGSFSLFLLFFLSILFFSLSPKKKTGQVQQKDGKFRPKAILPYKINAQYLIEGLVGGALFLFGGLSSLLLLLSLPEMLGGGPINGEGGGMMMWGGVGGVVVCSGLLVLFFNAKVCEFFFLFVFSFFFFFFFFFFSSLFFSFLFFSLGIVSLLTYFPFRWEAIFLPFKG